MPATCFIQYAITQAHSTQPTIMHARDVCQATRPRGLLPIATSWSACRCARMGVDLYALGARALTPAWFPINSCTPFFGLMEAHAKAGSVMGGGIAAAGGGIYTVYGPCTISSDRWDMATVILHHEYNALRIHCIPHHDIHPHAIVWGLTQAIHSHNTINTARCTSTANRTAVDTRARVCDAPLEPYTQTTPSI